MPFAVGSCVVTDDGFSSLIDSFDVRWKRNSLNLGHDYYKITWHIRQSHIYNVIMSVAFTEPEINWTSLSTGK